MSIEENIPLQNTQPSKESARPRQEKGEKLNIKVLLLDDDEAMRMLSALVLKDMGCSVEEFEDGKKLIEKFKSSKPNEYGLLISDKDMPKSIDGVEVLTAIHSLDNKLPLILYTGGVITSQMREAVRNLGGGVCLQKPFTLEQLRETVEQVVSKSRE